MKVHRRFFLILFAVGSSLAAAADPVIVYKDGGNILNIGKQVSIFEDEKGILTIEEILKRVDFQPAAQKVLNLGLSGSSFWLRFTVANESGWQLLLQLGQPTIDRAALYTIGPEGNIHEVRQGQDRPFQVRKYKHQNILFDLNVPPGEQRTFFLQIESKEQITLPLSIGSQKNIYESLVKKDLLLGLIFGVFLSMFFYNLFLYISVRDIDYVFYVVYILSILLSQASLQGYSFKYLWPGSPWMAQHAVFIFPSLASIAALLFTRIFLHTKEHAPNLDIILRLLTGFFGLPILLAFFRQYQASFAIMQVTTLVTSIFVLYIAFIILGKGYNPAKYFLLAWFALLVGAITLVLRDYGVFTSNGLTNNALVFGCTAEVVLLSFALADKISLLRKEKEESQEQAMAAIAEVAKLGREQNILLEMKVNERTIALKEANMELSKAMQELKEAESQLVESEKMASLGQLTAGIAHEINNPTNFVTSNVNPLKRDIAMIIQLLEEIEEIALSPAATGEKQSLMKKLKDNLDYEYLKTEIDHLINGIREGSNRTAEIVKGLHSFSRLDEDNLKKASVNEGIDSTLIIVNHMLHGRIKIIKNFGDLPFIECHPGKLNQVFLNIITNALQAIKAKFENRTGGTLVIATWDHGAEAAISFKDNGTGMDRVTMDKIFEPFFTTKKANEGIGLGMSIVYNIIQKHKGRIEIQSQPGEGTEFLIILPITHDDSGV